MKAIHNIYAPILLSSALILASCSSQNKIASNYYADGIYFDPNYANVVQATTEHPETSDFAQDGYDYYEPGTYTSPYEQELPNSGWSNSSYYGGYSPFGWGSGWNMGLGFGFGNPWGGGFNDMYYPYGGMMYPPYYNPYMYNPYYNPYMYNPYYGFGYLNGGWGPYNPMWGYPGAIYPYGGYGNDFGGFFNPNQPDIVFRGNSNPRPARNSAGNSQAGSSRNPAKGGKVAQTSRTATTYKPNLENSERLQSNSSNQTTAASRLRKQSLQNSQRSYTNSAIYNSNDSRLTGENRRLYEKTKRSDAYNGPRSRTSVSNTSQSASSSGRDKALERQTQRVIQNSGRQSNTGRTYTPQSRTRTYSPRSSDNEGATPTRTRSYTPSSSGGGGGSRPSGGGSSGGGGRPGGGSGTRR